MRRIIFSLFSFNGDCQSGSFVIQRNRDKLSTRKFDVGVFTQPGSKGEILAHVFRVTPESGRAVLMPDNLESLSLRATVIPDHRYADDFEVIWRGAPHDRPQWIWS
jgi:hypothetical protein